MGICRAGSPYWSDGFRFSGSVVKDAVAWYDRQHGDHTQPAGLKAPNQLGIFDMSGNVWEWCQDVFTQDLGNIPDDGTPYVGPERIVSFGGMFSQLGDSLYGIEAVRDRP